MNIEALTLSAAMALAAGLVGCFAVMRRMALAGVKRMNARKQASCNTPSSS